VNEFDRPVGRCAPTVAPTDMMTGGPLVRPEDVGVRVDAQVMATDALMFGTRSGNTKIVAAPSMPRGVPGLEVVEGLAVTQP